MIKNIRTAWNRGKQIRPPIIVKCDNCDLIFEKYKNNSKFNFCSRLCKGEWQKTNLIATNNPFYGKHHTEESKTKHSERMKGKRYPEEINKKKGHKGEDNHAYTNGYWFIRNQHLEKYLKNKCEKCCMEGNLEIHHLPSMNEQNCLQWNGIVHTLCRRCHMKEHRNVLTGRFEEIIR